MILAREQEAGGVARTANYDDSSFDHAIDVLYPRDPYATDHICSKFLRGNMSKQMRRSYYSPTLLLTDGFRLLDFGGNGEFALPEYKNRFYTSHGSRSGQLSIFGTMRYRPSRARAGVQKDKICHPVKRKAMIEPPKTRLKIVGRWALEVIAGGCYPPE